MNRRSKNCGGWRALARLGGACLLAWCLTAGAAAGQTLPPAAASVVSLTGEVSIRHPRSAAAAARLHDGVSLGDELITGPTGEAVIRSSDGSTVRVFPDSRVIYSEHSNDIQEFLHLFFGSIKVHIEKLSGRPNPHKMTTPTAVIAVRGTTFSVFVDDADSTLVAVDEGMVAVANRRWPSDETLVRPGERTWVRAGERPLRAQAFRGRSERADLIPWRATGTPMSRGQAGSGMGRPDDRTPGPMGDAMKGTVGMPGRPGPPH